MIENYLERKNKRLEVVWKKVNIKKNKNKTEN